MRNQTERLFLFNPFALKGWSNSQIKEQLDILIKKYSEEADTMTELALNVENLSNQNMLIGEMIARLTEEYSVAKAKLEVDENISIYTERLNWEQNNSGKAPAIKYFEALAKAKLQERYEDLAKKESDLKRFKIAFEAIEQKINALKKRMEAIKFELSGGLYG